MQYEGDGVGCDGACAFSMKIFLDNWLMVSDISFYLIECERIARVTQPHIVSYMSFIIIFMHELKISWHRDSFFFVFGFVFGFKSVFSTKVYKCVRECIPNWWCKKQQFSYVKGENVDSATTTMWGEWVRAMSKCAFMRTTFNKLPKTHTHTNIHTQK